MEQETFFSGYCRSIDDSRMVSVFVEDGQLTEVDCCYGSCVHQSNCPIAKEIEEKYTIVKSVPHYIWIEEEEAYWRKHYDLQEWFYDSIDGVENCGYYILDADMIAEMNEQFGENVPAEDPTDEEALFYNEWY